MSHQWVIESNTRREIQYLEATMYYFVYYIKILLRRKSQLSKREHVTIHSWRSEISVADWLSQTRVKNYDNFSCVVILFFSVVEIPIIIQLSYTVRIPIFWLVDLYHVTPGYDRTTSLTSISWCNGRGINSIHHYHYTKALANSKFDDFCLQCIQFE